MHTLDMIGIPLRDKNNKAVRVAVKACFYSFYITHEGEIQMKIGILGTGLIAKEVLGVIKDLAGIDEIYILATERSKQKALELKKEYNISKCFFDYSQMLESDADTMYVALPNNLHYEFTKKALEDSKNVILEKPATPNINQLNELIDLAKKRNVILVEAVNLYHLPAYKSLQKDVQKIGKPRIVSFNYSQYSSRYDAFKKGIKAPVFDIEKAGGALVDLNVYNIHAVLGLFGKPNSACYFPNIQNGIDTSGILNMSYDGFQAVCIGAKDCKAQASCTIQGENGTISFLGSPSMLTEYKVQLNNGFEEIYKTENPEHRLVYEFREFIKIIENKDFEKRDLFFNNSILAVSIMENARKKAGIYYADEKN